MKKQILTGLSAIAAAVALSAGSFTANASPTIPAPYTVCTYKGETLLTQPTGEALRCWLTITAKAGCDGDHVHIVAAGAVPGDPECPALFLGNMPWGGSLPSILAGAGTIDTGHAGIGLPWSVIDGSTFTPLAGGTIGGVAGSPVVPATCDTTTINVPGNITINGTFSFGGATLTTPSGGLALIGCN